MSHTPTPWTLKTCNYGVLDGIDWERARDCVNAFPDDLPTSAIAALNPEAVRALVDGRVRQSLAEMQEGFCETSCRMQPKEWHMPGCERARKILGELTG